MFFCFCSLISQYFLNLINSTCSYRLTLQILLIKSLYIWVVEDEFEERGNPTFCLPKGCWFLVTPALLQIHLYSFQSQNILILHWPTHQLYLTLLVASAKKSFPYMDIYACIWDKRWSQVWCPRDDHICSHDNREKLYMV